MRSNTERRKVFSHFGTRAKSFAAGALATVSLLATFADAQKTEATPELFVFRKDIGVVSAKTENSTALSSDLSGFEAVTGDFDADGIVDVGMFDRGARLFSVRLSRDGSSLVLSSPAVKGKTEVVTADFDGDGRSDFGVWRAGMWHTMLSSRQYGPDLTVFGIAGDVPVPADYDGDSKADFAIFRPSENRWYIRSSESGTVRTFDLGIAGTDQLLPADYSGDGKADPAVYRGSSWHWINSETGAEERFEFGFDDARPVPQDIDRDGSVDLVLFRKGTWYVYDGSRLASYKFGSDGDIPLSTVTVRSSFANR